MDAEIPATFVTYAADILGETQRGLSGTQIIKLTSACAVDSGIAALPNAHMAMKSKNTVARENILAFHGTDRYRVIKTMSEHASVQANPEVQKLRLKLMTQYGPTFGEKGVKDMDEPLIATTSHWLQAYPEASKCFEAAVTKHEAKVLARNLLDDLRLSLETLLKQILKNGKALENQKAELGTFLEERRSSAELRNMFQSMLAYYGAYQNAHVKHNDDVNSDEIEVMFELTACLLKHLVRLDQMGGGTPF
jgi:hypothetical protein